MSTGYERLDEDPPDADHPAHPLVAPFSSSSSAGLPFPVSTPGAEFSNGSRDPFVYPPVGVRRSTLGAAKWKGKGRADSPSPDGSSDVGVEDAARQKKLSFCVRFTDGQTEDLVDLWVGEKETVREVKRRIRLLRPDTLTEDGKPRRLRLIQLGRLLPDGVFLLPYTLQLVSRRAKAVSPTSAADVGVKEGLQAVGRGIGKVVRGTMGERAGEDEMSSLEKGKGREDERDLAEEEQEEEQVWLHCSVGEPIEAEEPAEEKDQSTQITPLQGFDRLRDAGFSEQDIENLRAEFRESRQTEADDEEHQRALEEQWMSGMTGQEEAVAGDAAGTGHYYSLLKGVCIGFFVPFLPLFFFRTQIFTRRMQIAIILGIIINLGFGILRLLG
ncbi:hypothetical protein Rt10032_c08g3530 [Rhodotorula toruloides]|uniref:Ubiquitin-like domain-containing protein n=1 Tax=Rhodotorula toruloides TaxID=5286 RepID=A0A511KGL7_RHOTO|nr:hypothetical protein Rt10032_c08g3530 [Rhodotorula toruloides]